MKYLVQFIRKLDVFKVPFSPRIDLKSRDVYYSSLIGGLFTIVIYAFVLFYGMILLSQWFRNEMAYKISSQEQNQDSELFANYFNSNKNSEQINFGIYWNSYLEDSIYPFQNNNTIVIPLLYDCYEYTTQNLLKYYNESSQQIEWNFYQNNTNYCYMIFILPCINNSQYLDSGQKCASKEESDTLFSKDGLELGVLVTTYGINFYNNEILSNQIYTVSFMQNDLSTFKALSIQYSYFEKITGFFSENSKQYLLMTDYQSRDQLGSQDYITKYSHYYRSNFQNVYGVIEISANTMIKYVNIQYPSLGEILANIASIAQTLLLIRFFLEYINRFLMNDEFQAFFIKVFIPDFALIKKKRKGLKSEYYLGDKKINTESCNQLSKTLTEQIEQKMSYSNLIYEVTKMQGVIDDLATQYQILSNHFKIVDLDLIHCGNKNEYCVLNYWNKTLENFEERKKQSFYPFSFNFSIKQQSEIFCKQLDADGELSSCQKNRPHAIMIYSQITNI